MSRLGHRVNVETRHGSNAWQMYLTTITNTWKKVQLQIQIQILITELYFNYKYKNWICISNTIIYTCMPPSYHHDYLILNEFHYLNKFNYWLHFININISKVLSFSWDLSGLKILPAVLKSRSTGADEAGMPKYSGTILAMDGNFFSLFFQ